MQLWVVILSKKLEKNKLDRMLLQVAANVKKYRKIKGLSQLSLAIEMGHKSVGLVSFAEAGINNKRFNLEHLATIAVILDVNISCFFEGVDAILKQNQQNQQNVKSTSII